MGQLRSLSTYLIALFISALSLQPAISQIKQTKGTFEDKFRQLENEDWPTPTDYRNAAGEPGHRYWQQQADYKIKVAINETTKMVEASSVITYKNNSPDTLRYVWFQLEQNKFKKDSLAELSNTVGKNPTLGVNQVKRAKRFQEWEGGFKQLEVFDATGAKMPMMVVDTQMRVDLAKPLKSGETITMKITWSYPLIETRVIGGRAGYECFTKPGEDGNCIFLLAQWFPRLVVYSDYEGWHNKAFLGQGEFTLEFGDYEVEITVPNDHVVASSGELVNSDDILSAAQKSRWDTSKTAAEAVYIVTPDEAMAAEKSKPTGTKTWKFKAKNVRDFAFASSRKFVWDAQGVKNDHPDHPTVMAMSFYPKEARPLWDAYSTRAIAHTLKVYGKFAFPYPYPTAISVNGPVGGMEYPMITFNGPRPTKDKKTGELTYSERTKYGLIGVIIHEIGHIWYPMVVNSDERQWTWMDEGINTFVQYQAHMEWDEKWPTNRGEPRHLTDYMISENQVPIMTNSESIVQFGNNAYGKPATAMVILRESVLGRERFDFAFKEYSRRWAFKRPTPYDFFRTMEEASGVDLDWFWRGWFYTTDHVDIELSTIVKARIDTRNPDIEKPLKKEQFDQDALPTTGVNNLEPTVVDLEPKMRDFYNETSQFTVTTAEKKKYQASLSGMDPDLKAALETKDHFYNFTFKNLGGLVMPVILKMNFADGTSQIVRIPAEVWRINPKEAIWQYVTTKQVTSAEIDPLLETADAVRDNNYFPRRIDNKTFGVTELPDVPNRMQDMELVVTPDSLKTKPKAKPAEVKK